MLEILINKKERENEIALLENGNLIEYYIDEENSVRKEGNIYVGIIKDVIKGMQAAFVDIGTEKKGFIHLKDLLPKIDEKKENIDKNINITDIVKPGQKVLVQVKKDSNLQKGARVSTHINMPSKYIVLMPNTDIITISQKIEDKKEQERLIKLVKENIKTGNGAVIRTSAIGKEQEIIDDIKNIEKRWDKIEKTFKNDKDNKPKLIAKSENIVKKMIIDLPEKSIEKIILNSKSEYEKIKKFKEETDYIKETNIVLKENENILQMYDIEKEISKLDYRKVWLKCGGFITIDKTEALTAIDVNTGKYTGNKGVEQTIYKVNEEATNEIVKQIRLRDIGGIIIIDYIDMNNEEHKKKIQDLLEKRLKEDRAKTQVEGFTKLDLMEMTRKHICSHKE
ncbi:MAG: Rne/Rng family ribonuclease [Clostridia bacterium]|nr:Rne/Rng family ribonuclease [Clostridia bacterium]